MMIESNLWQIEHNLQILSTHFPRSISARIALLRTCWLCSIYILQELHDKLERRYAIGIAHLFLQPEIATDPLTEQRARASSRGVWLE